jgi:hypothetical protein
VLLVLMRRSLGRKARRRARAIPPKLAISLRRINDEDRRAMRVALDDDAGYRAKVKRRMLEGLTMQQLPPLINREEVLAKRKAGTKVLRFGKGE